MMRDDLTKLTNIEAQATTVTKLDILLDFAMKELMNHKNDTIAVVTI